MSETDEELMVVAQEMIDKAGRMDDEWRFESFADCIEALRDRLRELTTWQPMETAPRDETTVMLKDVDGRQKYQASFDADAGEDGLWEFKYGGMWPVPRSDEENRFTGWRPIPE